MIELALAGKKAKTMIKILTNKARKYILGFSESCGLAVEHLANDRGFDPCPMLDGSGVKAMPGSISALNSGSLLKIRKVLVAECGTPKNLTWAFHTKHFDAPIEMKLAFFGWSC